MSNRLFVSQSPHVHDKNSTQHIMMHVLLALMPAFFVSVYFFGIGALIITAISVTSCVIFEWLITKFMIKEEPRINDLSAVVTGVLFAFCLPSNLPVGLVILGAFVSIGIGKMTFGGIGKNPFNPALVGRVFLFISFPVQMTNWPIPLQNRTEYPDASTGATILSKIKEGLGSGAGVPELMQEAPSHSELFVGFMGGSLGEIAAIAILIGFAWLLITKIITWHIPIIILGTVFIFTGALWLIDPSQYIDPLFHLMTGGLLLGAVFMATDYVTSPMSIKGQVFYAIGIGFLTVTFRIWSSYPEGVQFAILIMNAFVPLFNMYMKPKKFGRVNK